MLTFTIFLVGNYLQHSPDYWNRWQYPLEPCCDLQAGISIVRMSSSEMQLQPHSRPTDLESVTKDTQVVVCTLEFEKHCMNNHLNSFLSEVFSQ